MSGRVFGRLLAAAAVAAALGGCSLGDGGEEPRPISGAPKEVAAAIARLERATKARDWRAICTDLFSRTALRRAGGRDCERLLREQAQDVRRPEIQLMSIDLERDRARVEVRTRASGQAVVDETILLLREAGQWRIDSLAAG